MCDCDCELPKAERWAQVRAAVRREAADELRREADSMRRRWAAATTERERHECKVMELQLNWAANHVDPGGRDGWHERRHQGDGDEMTYQVVIPGKLWEGLRLTGAFEGGVLDGLRVTERPYGMGTRVTVTGRAAPLRQLLGVIERERVMGPARDLGVEHAVVKRAARQPLLPG